MEDYLSFYESLTEREQELFMLLAAATIHGTKSATQIVAYAKKCGFKTPQGKTYTNQAFNTNMAKAVKLKLCAPKGSPVEILDSGFKGLLLAEAIRKGKLEKFRKAIIGDGGDRYRYWDNAFLFAKIKFAFLQNRASVFTDTFNRIYNNSTQAELMFELRVLLYDLPADIEITNEEVLQQLLEDTNSQELLYGDISPTKTARLEQLTQSKNNELAAEAAQILCCQYYLQGDIASIEKYQHSIDSLYLESLCPGLIAFVKGDYPTALNHLAAALAYKRKTVKRNWYFRNPIAIAHLLSLAFVNKSTDKQITTLSKQVGKLELGFLYQPIIALLYFQAGNRSKCNDFIYQAHERDIPLASFLLYIAKHLTSYGVRKEEMSDLKDKVHLWDKSKFKLLAFQGAALANLLGAKLSTEKQYANEAYAQQKWIDQIKQKEDWEIIMDSLLKYGETKKPAGTIKTGSERIIWLISVGRFVLIQPKLQKQSANGNWSKGRNVALKSLKEQRLSCMTEQDRLVSSAIITSSSYYGATEYEFNEEKALLHLCGHPELYLMKMGQQQGAKFELVRAQPELIIKSNKKSFSLSFSNPCDTEGVFLVKETLTKYKVVEITKEHCDLYAIFGQNKISLPNSAKAKLQKAMAGISSVVTIQSDLKHADENLKSVRADAKIHVLILPLDDGIKAELFVKPFKKDAPYLKPGKGGVNIISEIDGQRLTTSRNLAKEKENAQRVHDTTPELQELSNYHEVYIADNPEKALQFLSELQAIKEQVVIEWPQGEKFSLAKKVGYDDLFVNINKKNDWFEIDGELKVNSKLVLSLRELLQLVENRKSDFVEMSNGQFLALSKQLRKQLDSLNAYTQKSQKKLNINKLAAHAIDDFTEQLPNLKASKAWFEQKKRMQDALAIEPEVPSTLQAELRDYQVTGYNWLSQLAAMGVGACLADDMGLGKTMQSIAMLLQRAQQGPALIVAPASVANNWMHEIRKFAPTLNAIDFRNSSRETVIKSLKEFDALVCSYGLLQSSKDLIAAQTWSTIILDEAHVIKNSKTKTAKAAMELQGDFRILTTGTPVQNHLGELWSLFNFLNKGLLGSAENFNKRFVADSKAETKKALNKLIKPFVLRRTKTQVLDELPSKTEITLDVELSAEETAFYEAVRQNALAELEKSAEAEQHNQLQILAEITKMRQACCHPQLVMKDSKIKSSKMNVFTELLEEILSGKHKVLVFSQFVSFLSIARKELERMGINYKYLDGSTSIKQRDEQIKAFQSGDGDVFLISLRAGGFGLNLTAADYVIHLDPWWNPAVEDQASDRAHRIGQTRPVTVYRLVTKNAIEEKIIALHKAKRQLADNILDGTDESGKISASELLGLIKEK